MKNFGVETIIAAMLVLTALPVVAGVTARSAGSPGNALNKYPVENTPTLGRGIADLGIDNLYPGGSIYAAASTTVGHWRWPDLSWSYLIAAGTILFLYLAAKQNRKQGWRRRRVSLFEAALEAFEQPQESRLPEAHLGDLSRLSQALLSHGEPIQPEAGKAPAESQKSGVLA